jgi:uncharacterized sulfatase
MQDTKPVEELYDIQADPFEQLNLADSPQHQTILRRMREVHIKWSRRTLDLGLLPEQDMRDRARGATEYEMARSGAGRPPFDRILETALLSGQGPDAVPELVQRLDDDDAAVRFWAVIGLTNTAVRDESVVRALQALLDDSSLEVRIVAAEALCRIDREDGALPVLTDALSRESQWIRLQAANVLDRIGEKARPAIDAIERAAEDPNPENMFVRWVLGHTRRQLGQ